MTSMFSWLCAGTEDLGSFLVPRPGIGTETAGSPLVLAAGGARAARSVGRLLEFALLSAHYDAVPVERQRPCPKAHPQIVSVAHS